MMVVKSKRGTWRQIFNLFFVLRWLIKWAAPCRFSTLGGSRVFLLPLFMQPRQKTKTLLVSPQGHITRSGVFFSESDPAERWREHLDAAPTSPWWMGTLLSWRCQQCLNWFWDFYTLRLWQNGKYGDVSGLTQICAQCHVIYKNEHQGLSGWSVQLSVLARGWLQVVRSGPTSSPLSGSALSVECAQESLSLSLSTPPTLALSLRKQIKILQMFFRTKE